MTPKTITIIGGGITGLTAAYYVKKSITQLDLPYEVKVIEASERVGGKLNTVHKDNFVLERGADSFLERKTPAIKLVKELGLTEELVRNSTGQAYILKGESLHKIPAGSHMGIPLKENVLNDSELISSLGKERIMEDLTLPKGEPSTDQSLGHFLRGRFGDELIENLIEPLLSGIYSSDMDEMSLMASFPQFYELEQEYGSLIQGLRETLPSTQASTGKRKGQFLSFKNGLETLVQALVHEIGEDNILLNTAVDKVTKTIEGYELLLDNGKMMDTDGLIMTVPHSLVPDMMEEQPMFDPLATIPMSSVANVVLAFDQSQIQEDLDGTGFVVSRNSDFRMTACTWTHRKWPSTTPDGKVLMRTYVGKPTDQDIVHQSDEEIVEVVLTELNKIMDIKGQPEFTMVTRWIDKMPQYTIGHVETLRKLRSEMADELPGMYLAGSSYEGVGIPDCIEQAEKAATRVIQFLQEK